MMRLRLRLGPLVAVAFLAMGAGIAIAAYVAQIEPETQLQTDLPLARI